LALEDNLGFILGLKHFACQKGKCEWKVHNFLEWAAKQKNFSSHRSAEYSITDPSYADGHKIWADLVPKKLESSGKLSVEGTLSLIAGSPKVRFFNAPAADIDAEILFSMGQGSGEWCEQQVNLRPILNFTPGGKL
jgi:hypothetical protein